MKEWLQGIVAASVISSLAMILTPPGRVRFVTRMACGILCSLAIVSPVLRLDMQALSVSIASYEQAAQKVTKQAEEESKMLERTYIEQECQAYILSKAEENGVPLGQVHVSARWDDDAGVWYPWSADMDCSHSPRLSVMLESSLGIPPERQNWNRGEEGRDAGG